MAWPAHQGLLPFLLNTPLLYHQAENDGIEMKIFNKCVKCSLKKGLQGLLKSLRFLFVSRLYIISLRMVRLQSIRHRAVHIILGQPVVAPSSDFVSFGL